MNAREMRDYALGTMSAWIDGYTDPDDKGVQSKIRVLGEDYEHGFISVSVEKPANSGNVRVGYLIEVKVTAIPLGRQS